MKIKICAAHLHRSYTPIDVHHVWPRGLGGPDIESNRVAVCPNGHRQVHEYLRLLQKDHGVIPWKTRRRFGRKVRKIAEAGYAQLTPWS